MSDTKKKFLEINEHVWAGGVLGLFMASSGAAGVAPQNSTIVVHPQKQVETAKNGFYCNINALTAEERVRHKELTEKLISARQEIVESEKGYEFQYRAEDLSLTELAGWVATESKCCPFFDFHIDLEREGNLVCLRLTGEEGIKTFIRAEFGVGK